MLLLARYASYAKLAYRVLVLISFCRPLHTLNYKVSRPI